VNGFDRGRAFQLFEQALGLGDSTRTLFLRDQCGDDVSLRREVEALLLAATADGAPTSVLLNPTERSIENLVGEQFGHFRLVEFIGEGGMGVVYRAERIDGILQTVAIKLIGNELARTGQERFKRETQLLARLEHPAIARLIDAGVEQGRAWIALEFVPGRPIDTYCDDEMMPMRSRVRLLAELAGAVAAAHRMLVVHRDIKPANVLVNAEGSPKLIDFGIAAALEDATTAHTQTADIGRLFTPHYAAPEQVSGEPITVATDVFGLGALGYRLLTGQTLYPEARGAIGYLLAITQREVDAPSRAAQNAADPHTAKQLRGDLDAILRKALERDPVRRYSSAAEMQADLRRYLDDVPVVARPPSVAVRAGKFVRRNFVAVSLATVFSVGLMAAGIAYVLQARNAAEAREMAARRGEFLEELLKSANPRGGKHEVTVAKLLDESANKIGGLVEKEPLVGASLLGLVAESNMGLGRYPEGLASSTREIEILRANRGNALDLAEALSIRGELLIAGGHDLDAQAPLREALALVEHRGATKQLAAALEGLAKAEQNLGHEAQAELLYKREIEVYRNSGEDFGGKVGFPLSGLATLRYDQGRYAESAAYMEKALKIERSKFPADHPDLLDAEYNYAVTLEQSHQAPQAEPVFRQLLASYRRILGRDHSETYSAQQGLAHDLLSQKRYQEAADEALPAAQGLSRTLGDDDSWTLTAWGVYGISACLAGHGDAGLEALRRVAVIRAKQPIENHWRTMVTDVQIGTCLIASRRFAEAEPLLLGAVAALERERGVHNDHTQAGYRALRDLYANSGRQLESDVWQKKILDGG